MSERRCPRCEATTELADECYECQVFMSKGGVVRVDQGLKPQLLKEQCSKGHRYTAENTVMQKSRGKYRRVCRECRRGYTQAYWHRSGAEVRKIANAKRKQEQGRLV